MRNSSELKNTQEIPVTGHLFEGHLYIKENDKWIWRLFRFDGSSFICLSSKKSKLPASLSLSSTTKNRTVRLTNETSSSCCQLTKWAISMSQISAISILKPKEKKTYSTTTTNKLRCFTVRTYGGGCYILKAHKQDDLERWIFVLSKMGKLYQPSSSSVIDNNNNFFNKTDEKNVYNINFFQDAITVSSDESIIKYNHHQTLTYHDTLLKKHQVQVVNSHQPKIYTDENVCLADVQKYLKHMNK